MALTPTFRSGGSGGTLQSRPRPAASVRAVYEDFTPMIEWQQDEESNSLLLIYLPGFRREHLKVSTEGKNILRARGERLVAGNKWSRFQQDYPLPEDCNVRGIRAKFEEGILKITIPRKREAEDASKEAAKATEDMPKPSQKTQEELSSKKQPSPPKAAFSSGPSALPSVRSTGKGRDEKIRETPPDQKMLSEKTKKGPNEEPEKSKEESGYQKSAQKVQKLADQAEDAIKKTIEEAEKDKGGSAYEDFRPLEAKKREKSEKESDYPKGARKDKKVPDQVENIMRETTEKPKSQKDKGYIEPEKKKTSTAAAASSSTDYGLANFLDLNGERQLLVNVAAAVIVIVAFGAYLLHISGEAT